MIEVTVCGCGELERAEADVIEGLVVKSEALIRVLHELVHRQCSIVRLDHGVGHLGRGDDREGGHDAVGVLLSDLGDEQRAHSGTGASAHRVGQLEALKTVARLRLLADHVKNRVDQLGSLSVMALGPVVSRSGLAEHEVVGTEELAEGAGANGVHGSRLEVHEDGARHVSSAGRLVEVYIDALQLEVGVAVVGARGVNAVLVSNHFPELGSDLVAALTALDVDDLSHGVKVGWLSFI